ncbi:MAG: hypothetical protein ACTSWW_00305 [Promethearchaeota archaeon]
MRKDYFLFGLGSRIIMLGVFLLVNQKGSYNDASEIIYYAFQNLFKGTNPYSTVYDLNWGTSTFTQPFNYGPMTLLLLLPAMLLPIWYKDLWIGMTVLINIYSFLTAEYISQLGSRDMRMQNRATISHEDKDPRQNQVLYYGGIFFWLIPVGTTCITVFIYAPIFLAVVAFDKLRHPVISGVLISLAAMSYQLIYLFIPVFVIYHFKRGWREAARFILGCLPALLLLLLFELWPPGGVINSLFLYTGDMPYNKCPTCNNDFDQWSVFSIPRILYNISDGAIQIGPLLRLILVILLGVLCLWYLFSHRFDHFEEFFLIRYLLAAVVGFTLTTNYGQSHYLIFLFPFLLYYYQMKKPDFRKNKPIGAGILTWKDFDEYVTQTRALPL